MREKITMAVAVETGKRNFKAAIDHLPEGGTLIFQHVPWREYESLLDEMGAGYRARISYDRGKLEVEMPLPIRKSLIQ
jgi:hypothetical protein